VKLQGMSNHHGLITRVKWKCGGFSLSFILLLDYLVHIQNKIWTSITMTLIHRFWDMTIITM